MNPQHGMINGSHGFALQAKPIVIFMELGDPMKILKKAALLTSWKGIFLFLNVSFWWWNLPLKLAPFHGNKKTRSEDLEDNISYTFRLSKKETWEKVLKLTVPWKLTNANGQNNPFEDVSPIKNGDFPASHLRFRGVYHSFHDACTAHERNVGRSTWNHSASGKRLFLGGMFSPYHPCMVYLIFTYIYYKFGWFLW